jgi:hypothetical protein
MSFPPVVTFWREKIGKSLFQWLGKKEQKLLHKQIRDNGINFQETIRVKANDTVAYVRQTASNHVCMDLKPRGCFLMKLFIFKVLKSVNCSCTATVYV